MSCKIDRGAAFDCTALVQGGIKNFVYLINKEDFDTYQTLSINGTTDEISDIVLAEGTQGYKFEAPKGSLNIIPSSPLRTATSIDAYDHQLDIRSFDVSQLSRDNITKLRFQKVIAIVPLADGRFELYGRNVGMRISDLQYMPGDSDNGGTLQFVLKTPENDPAEINLPILIESTFDITTLDTAAPLV